jgi:diguanylate cyclase (GGDEF)-like protein/PAS domain S-box-containing protein
MEAASTKQRTLDERTLNRLFETAGALVALIDLKGRLVYVSPAFRRLLGYEPEELVGSLEKDLIPPGLIREARASFRHVRDGKERLRQRLVVRRRGGSYLHLRFDATPMRTPDGTVDGIAVAAQEVSYEPNPSWSGATAGPERSEGELIERLPVVVYVAEPGVEGRWSYVSGQIEHLLGYTAAEWKSDPTLWAQRLHPDDRDRVIAEEESDAARGAPVSSEYRLLARDGKNVWVRDEAVLRFDADGVARYDGLLIDVTERKAIESRLEFFADHDALTGLLNRRRIMAEIDAELRRLRRHGGPASLLVADLDDLKTVNDTCGHPVGDALICAAAEVLVERLRESDSVARVGGDEFVALLRGAGPENATAVAHGLVRVIGRRAQAVTGGAARTGISVGVADLDPLRGGAEALEVADKLMYEAKRQGGGRVASGTPH